MKIIEDRIKVITEKLETIDKEKNKELFLTEMKKIGIEKLPYAYSALKQFIDAETMTYHYNKHYKGYVEKLNVALEKGKYGDLELEQIIKSIGQYNKTIRNNAGGAFNHALFWKMLTPKTQKPNGRVFDKIVKQYGSFNEFKTKFEEVAKQRFGSGWVWLVLTKQNRLKIVSTPNQDNPLMNVVKNGGYPLLGLDLWEHAYYLKYRNKRDEYINNFWKCVNWEFVDKLFSMRVKSKINESQELKTLITEQKSERCSRELTEKIRQIFNSNPDVKNLYKVAINRILKDVFPDNFYGKDQYSPGEMSGVYDLEGDGRSVINKLNTNYSTFCVLMQDVNKVLVKLNKPEINLIGRNNFDQISETKRFIKVIDYYKSRIFAVDSSTFHNLMSVLNQTNTWGEQREDYVVVKLKTIFGDDNVSKIGKLGSKDDMIGGIDCEIKVDGQLKTSQIKPFTGIKKEGGNIIILGSGNVKNYKTDWLIFAKNNKEVLVFDNKDTKIVGGMFVFPENNLIYTID
jgi:Fe-Mn family superoxide dismutase